MGTTPSPSGWELLETGDYVLLSLHCWYQAQAWAAAHLLNEQHELVFEGWIRSFLPKSHLEVLAKRENG